MKLRNFLIFTSLILSAPLFAQPVIGHVVSVGVAAGGSLTDAFSSTTLMGVDTFAHDFSASKDYIVGPTIEVHLPLHLSVEFDALYRPLNLTISNTVVPIGVFTNSRTVNSWEFPLLAKYRLPISLAKPFLEAGPEFRRVQTFVGDNPHLSRAGFTLGGGVEFKLGPIRIDPEIRYTRWGADSTKMTPNILSPASNVNQAEALLGLTF